MEYDKTVLKRLAEPDYEDLFLGDRSVFVSAVGLTVEVVYDSLPAQ